MLIPTAPTQQATVKPLTAKIDAESLPKLTSILTHLSSYRTRHANTDTGVQAANWIRDQVQAIINSLPAERKSLFSVRLFQHTGFRQPSVIATMKGKTNEIVILGSHEDSTGKKKTNK